MNFLGAPYTWTNAATTLKNIMNDMFQIWSMAVWINNLKCSFVKCGGADNNNCRLNWVVFDKISKH